MKKMMTSRSKKFTIMVALIAAVAILATTLIIGTTFSSFNFKAPFETDGKNGELVATITRGVDADEKTLTDGFTTKTVEFACTTPAYAGMNYTNESITVTDGATPFYTDATHFTDFAPGQVRLEAFKVENTGTVPINLNMNLKYTFDSTEETTQTWDEQDPGTSLERQIIYKITKKDGTVVNWTSVQNLSTMSSFATEKPANDQAILLEVDDYVEIYHFVGFKDGGVPATNVSGDNQYMNSKYSWLLTFNCSQP